MLLLTVQDYVFTVYQPELIASHGYAIVVLRPVPYKVHTTSATRTLIDAMIQSTPEHQQVFDSAAPLITNAEALDQALMTLEDHAAYMMDAPLDRELVNRLAACTANAPEGNSVQDLLMVSYLASLLRAQALIADKSSLLL
jgi:hypothetical protein